ncbi:GNAT family N-acetyltransferase [Sporobolomyces salmoneus]|uniref:GNAT family N-acetyltransferase n=1 Tax=Sporobolomyces salmoneus TaxID=183962 RepID=UPI00316E0DF8
MPNLQPEEIITLVPFDPEDQIQVDTLNQQRILCGWNLDMIETWREQARRGVKGLYWIFPADTEAARTRLRLPLPERESFNQREGLGPPAPHPEFTPLGHASLDWEDYEGDESLANRAEGVITIATFYILASQQGLGLGNIVMKALEAKAISLGATQVTLNTLCGIAAQTREMWASIGVEYDPKARLNEFWYEKLGYEVYKREPRYKEKAPDGSIVKLPAVFMRKML